MPHILWIHVRALFAPGAMPDLHGTLVCEKTWRIVHRTRGPPPCLDPGGPRQFAAISAEVFPGSASPDEFSAGDHQPFFSDAVARTLLPELHEDPDPLSSETPRQKREPVPHVDVPVSRSLNDVLALVAKARQDDTRTIEPLDLLAGIVENRDSRLAQLLRACGITRL